VSKARLVVTGASGYVGGRLVAAASDAGFDVRSVVRSHTPWLQGPIVRVESLERDGDRVVEGADAVVHLAGANEITARRDPDDALAATVSASRAVAESCARSGVARLVYLSTVHVYGAALAPGAVVDEDVTPAPLNAYATARLQSEEAIEAACAGTTTEVVVLRLTNGVGPPADPSVDRWSLVANDLCRQAVCDGTLQLATDGMQWRDFVALGDVDRILLAATDPNALTANTYNLGSGQPTRVRELAEMIAGLAASRGLGPATVEAPAAIGDPPQPYRVDVERLTAAGYRPTTPLDTALSETLLFCSEHRHRLCESV
jgi:UDP-glucose 4-epimerase